MIKPIASLILLAMAGSSDGRRPTGPIPTIYRNDGGEEVVFTRDSMAVEGVTYPLHDCSTGDTACLSSANGFLASFPRICPQSTWLPQEGPMKWSSGFPHSFGSRYLNRSGSSFLYDWDRRQGLVSFLFDPTKNFAGLPPSYVREGASVYYQKSGPALLACSQDDRRRGGSR